jgi:hypothetical protein
VGGVGVPGRVEQAGRPGTPLQTLLTTYHHHKHIRITTTTGRTRIVITALSISLSVAPLFQPFLSIVVSYRHGGGELCGDG